MTRPQKKPFLNESWINPSSETVQTLHRTGAAAVRSPLIRGTSPMFTSVEDESVDRRKSQHINKSENNTTYDLTFAHCEEVTAGPVVGIFLETARNTS